MLALPTACDRIAEEFRNNGIEGAVVTRDGGRYSCLIHGESLDNVFLVADMGNRIAKQIEKESGVKVVVNVYIPHSNLETGK